jgi:23S rRNA pseudouridine2605 synthase
MQERVQKILSQWGIASRRHAEAMIVSGRVALNGKVALLGDKADPNRDYLEVDGKRVEPLNRPQLFYILMNKPKGVLSTCDDPKGRKTVIELLPPNLQQGKGIHPVGRLDRNSTGALILSNDGELTLRLTHPRYHLPKTYDVWVEGHPSDSALEQWRQGMILDGQKTLPAQLEILEETPHQTRLLITLTEGKNRQIRRLAEQLGLVVTKLHRRSIGNLALNQGQQRLLPGEYRLLKPTEVSYLKRHVQLEALPALPVARRSQGRPR